jgi:metal-dependent hydrolase (beta-lactamase superfamily II)
MFPGLPAALEAAPAAELWLHPAAIEPKFIRTDDGRARRISTDFMERAEFGEARIVHRVTHATEVVPGVWVTGEVPRINDFEDVGGPFFLDEGMERPDPIADDMSIYLPQADRLSVIFGCAHAGSINTLDHISNRPENFRSIRSSAGCISRPPHPNEWSMHGHGPASAGSKAHGLLPLHGSHADPSLVV